MGGPILKVLIGTEADFVMAHKNLKVVRLVEPEICLECRFAHMADVQMKDGAVQRMIHCRRLDCDNWDYESVEEAESLDLDDVA